MIRPVVLTIAGHDPSGGAGVTADQRVIEAIGGTAVSAVTAITVQNTQGVRSIHATDPTVLAAQIAVLFEDCDIKAVKIGMLGGIAQVAAVTEALRRFRPPIVVVDPVLASTGGTPLLDDAGTNALLFDLVPVCDVITPNLDEAARLTGVRVTDQESMLEAGQILLNRGAHWVVVKGGHLCGDPVDLLLSNGDEPVIFASSRIVTDHSHGTGCFLSSAIAAYLASGLSMVDAVRASREILRLALGNPLVIGSGRGYPRINYV